MQARLVNKLATKIVKRYIQSSLHCTQPQPLSVNLSYRHCKCVNSDGSEVPNSLTLVLGNSAPPTCASEQTNLLPVGNFAQVNMQPTSVPLVDFEATTVDDHGFNPKQASAIEPAKNLHALPPCEYEIQFGTGRKPKCDENGSYYPVQCETPRYSLG